MPLVLSRFGASGTGGKKRQGDSGYDGNPQSFSDTTLTCVKTSLSLFFGVISGPALVSHLVGNAPEAPAPVPLPAAGLLMMAGLGALSVLRKRQKAS
jgi:hypothetical protein